LLTCTLTPTLFNKNETIIFKVQYDKNNADITGKQAIFQFEQRLLSVQNL